MPSMAFGMLGRQVTSYRSSKLCFGEEGGSFCCGPRIWHKGLLHKLKSYGITGPYHATISDFLTNHQIKVVLDGQSSSVFLINSGVP